MVDMDKQVCRKLAEDGFKNGQWPESYITWEFLEAHPRAMESGYFKVEWNSIPGVYARKAYMRILIIERKEWDHLSNPTLLERYWEPTQDPGDFHRTLVLVFCWTPYHDCEKKERSEKFVMSVAIVRKPSRHVGLPFADAAEEFRDNTDMPPTPTLLLVRLHRKSRFVPDIYYHRYGKHFTIMHDTGQGYNVGHPQKFLRALLHNASTSGKSASLKAKLPPAYLNMPAYSPLLDSCTREYRDWSHELVPEGARPAPPEEHFVWLSSDHTPFENDLGSAFVPPDFTLGLPPVWDWPRRAGDPPWVLDPEEHPKPDHQVPIDSAGISSMDEGKKKRKKKKKKKHCHSKKSESEAELKVTTRGVGVDTLVWSITNAPKDTSLSSSKGDSGLGSNASLAPHQTNDIEPQQNAVLWASPIATRNVTEDAPLSDHGNGDGDAEMVDAVEQENN